MNEVKKPVIPRQVAEAIEWMQRKHSEYAPRDLPQIYSISQANDGAHKSYGIIADYARSDGNRYFEAIVNGYEIEKSAEELAEEKEREQLRLIKHRYRMLCDGAICLTRSMCVEDYGFLLNKIDRLNNEGVNA